MGLLFTAQALELIGALIGGLATFVGAVAASGFFEKLAKLFDLHRGRSSLLISPKMARSEGLVKRIDPHFSESLELSESMTAVHTRGTHVRFGIAKKQALLRLTDARNASAKQQRLASWARWSANSLTFGQYVIGGVMATSFIQKQLSPDAVGVFGVLVVAASLVKQHYHPEINGQIAAQKAILLESLIRQSEDRLVVIEATRADSSDDPALVLELLERISAELTKILAGSVIGPAVPPQKRGR